MEGKMAKQIKSFRLSAECIKRLEQLSNGWKRSQADVVSILISAAACGEDFTREELLYAAETCRGDFRDMPRKSNSDF
jgi:predicted DNA-binding protein